ncbi:MAG: chemotaxis protein CheW [Thiolinea sp.]
MNSPYELLTGLALLREKKRRHEKAGDNNLNAWSALIIKMGNETCVVHQSDVEEILTQDKLTRVVGVAPWMAGLGFFQGSLLNVIDGQSLFDAGSQQQRAAPAAIRILVVQGDKEWFGLRVSELVGIRHVWSDDVNVVPPDSDHWSTYVEQWIRIEDQVLPVLKLKQLAQIMESSGSPVINEYISA